MRTLRPTLVVGIGGSAGALNAYKTFLDAMPSNTGMAFVIVSHITPTANSQLAQVLSRHTKMKVVVALAAMPIRTNHLYVIPPDVDLFIEGDTLKVISPRSKRNVQIDLFFTSLAKAMGPRAVGIVLSGFDGDGTEGCRQIKANGGTTFAQDASAEVKDMPLKAQAAGCIDFVLPPEMIPSELKKLLSALNRPPPPPPGGETGELTGPNLLSQPECKSRPLLIPWPTPLTGRSAVHSRLLPRFSRDVFSCRCGRNLDHGVEQAQRARYQRPVKLDQVP